MEITLARRLRHPLIGVVLHSTSSVRWHCLQAPVVLSVLTAVEDTICLLMIQTQQQVAAQQKRSHRCKIVQAILAQ